MADLTHEGPFDGVGRPGRVVHAWVRRCWVGMTLLTLAGAMLESCQQSQDNPPPIGQLYEAGGMGGGGGGGTALGSIPCACPTPMGLDGGMADAARGTCHVGGFPAKAASFALPSVVAAPGPGGAPPLTSLDGSDACSLGGTASWSVVDMNGDEAPDFVLTRACSDS